jgi:hypothetical protein
MPVTTKDALHGAQNGTLDTESGPADARNKDLGARGSRAPRIKNRSYGWLGNWGAVTA